MLCMTAADRSKSSAILALILSDCADLGMTACRQPEGHQCACCCARMHIVAEYCRTQSDISKWPVGLAFLLASVKSIESNMNASLLSKGIQGDMQQDGSSARGYT